MMDEKELQEDWQVACDAADFEGEELLECMVGDRQILLVRAERGIVACPTICPHMEERLAHGIVDGNVLTCTKHLWQWDLCTGEPVGLAELPLPVAPVRSKNGKLVVNIVSLGGGGSSCN